MLDDIDLGPSRPMSRELVGLPREHGPRRLHVDRPCYVHRERHGRWGWQCSLCPLPHCLTSTAAASWREAVAEADRHIRTMHTTASGAGTPADTEAA